MSEGSSPKEVPGEITWKKLQQQKSAAGGKPQGITRRKFLLGLTSLLLLGAPDKKQAKPKGPVPAKLVVSESKFSEPPAQSDIKPEIKIIPQPILQKTDQPPVQSAPEAVSSLKDLANEILQLPLDKPFAKIEEVEGNWLKRIKDEQIPEYDPKSQRRLKEEELVNKAETREEITLGFLVITHRDLRAELLDKRYELRLQGLAQMPKLKQEFIKKTIAWAESKGYHPEVVLICQEAYEKAKPIIAQKIAIDKKGFRPDLVYKMQELKKQHDSALEYVEAVFNNLTADTVMLNPGGLAELICTETGAQYRKRLFSPQPGREFKGLSYGFANLGEVAAIDQIKEPHFSKDDFCQLFNKIGASFGLIYNPQNIPGSVADAEDISGGAVAGMMPNIALKKFEELAEYGIKYSPMEPESAALAMILRIAEGEVNLGFGPRYGYIRASSKTRPVLMAIKRASLAKWNGAKNQIDQIIESANSYFD